jgi:hypothetical protein
MKDEMSPTNRRRFLEGTVIAAASAVGRPAAAHNDAPMLAVGNRTHIFVHPSAKEKLIWCFGTVLGCGSPVILNAPGRSEPMLAFKFPSGGSLSVEFTEAALEEPAVRRGAWLEIWSNDPAALGKKVLDAGLPQVFYDVTNTFYFAAPGGQVFGIVSAGNPSAGEMRRKL